MLSLEEIEKYATELNDNLRHVTEFKTKLEELIQAVQFYANRQNHDLIREVRMLREEVDMLTKHLMLKGMPGINRYEIELQKMKALVNSDEWPEAVPPEMIPQSEEAKETRAENILNVVVTEFLDKKRFLDAGCGEGHVAAAAAKRGAAISVGFDIKPQWKLAGSDNLIFTPDPEVVRKSSPYDVILLYDVLDHLQGVDPSHFMQQIRNTLAPGGKVYVRTHPWCSRHGGHLYTRLNKAYVHMLFDESEFLRLFGIKPEFVLKMPNPVQMYEKWFRDGGFVIKDQTVISKKIDELFMDVPPVVQNRLAGCHVNPSDMGIEYIDYTLEAPTGSQVGQLI